MSPDIVILNGHLVTFDPACPGGTALAIRDGRIVALGETAEIRALAGPDTQVLDAGGGTVLPGIIDSHVHLFGGSAELDYLDLHGVEDIDRLTALVRAYAAENPRDRLIMGVGASYHPLGAGRAVTRGALDAVLPDRPLALMTADHHTIFANTAALEQTGLLHGRDLAPGNEIVMGADGTATGVLKEFDAYSPVLRLSRHGGRELLGLATGHDPDPPATAAERAVDKDVLARGLAHCARNGLTTLHNMDGNVYQLELLAELEAEGRMPCRVQVPLHIKNTDPLDRIDEAVEMRRRFAGDRLWSGRVKMFMDGVLDSFTALMIDAYPGQPGQFGEALFTPEQFNEICVRADAAGLQISVHAIGDLAVRRTLDGYAAARAANGVRDSRHRVEHIEVIHPDDIPRLRDLGAVASMQVLHSPLGGFFDGDDAFGTVHHPHHKGFVVPWRRLHEAGVPLVFSTDWPVVPVAVMPGIRGAVAPHLPGPDWVDQSLPLMDVLAACTRDNAWVEFTEDRKGRLSPGFLADVTVLDTDVTAIPGEALDRVGIAATICDGRITARA